MRVSFPSSPSIASRRSTSSATWVLCGAPPSASRVERRPLTSSAHSFRRPPGLSSRPLRRLDSSVLSALSSDCTRASSCWTSSPRHTTCPSIGTRLECSSERFPPTITRTESQRVEAKSAAESGAFCPRVT